MKSRIYTANLQGIQAQLITVEVDLLHRLPGITIVGLPGNAVRESSERVRCAIQNSGFQFPRYRITVNLAPASLKKEGSGLDLPIALAILQASGQLSRDLSQALVAGELSLHGELSAVRGLLNCAALLQEDDFSYLVCAEEGRATLNYTSLPSITAANLRELVMNLEAEEQPSTREGGECTPESPSFSAQVEVRGQPLATRAMELAAAGGHHAFMMGPPGVGKTLLARSLPALLPALSSSQALEVNQIYSALGTLSEENPWIQHPPFRAPHVSISNAGLTGGQTLRPGEVTLAHHGVLFLDELLEFRPSVLECLRGPLEEGWIHIARSQGSMRLPASFTMVAASNPCPCGYLNHPEIPCRCHSQRAQLYQSRCSGPLLDRLPLRVMMESHPQWSEHRWAPSEARARVRRARTLQQERNPSGLLNSRIRNWPEQLRSLFSSDLRSEVSRAARLERWSSRELNQRISVSRTAADLRGSGNIEEADWALSMALRSVVMETRC